jgi:hypothetical protein
MLIVSPVAAWLSFFILIFLIFASGLAFLMQRRTVKRLDRDVDSPASVFGYVYASKRLQTWAEDKDLAGQWDDGAGSRIEWKRSRKSRRQDEDVTMSLDDFTGEDGASHWGVEADAAPVLQVSPNQNQGETGHEMVVLPAAGASP